MRIGLDASWAAAAGTGTASYTRGLVRALIDQDQHEFILYFRTGDDVQNPLWDAQGYRVRCRVVGGMGQIGRSLIALGRAASADRLDVFHSPGYFLPLWHGPKVVTFHDVNMFLQWDKWWRPGMRRSWAALCGQTILSSRTARIVLADSAFSAFQIRRTLRLPADRVRVVYPGVDDLFFTSQAVESVRRVVESFGLDRYVLTVGVLSPQKNIEGVIEAVSQLDDTGCVLVCVGKEDGPYYRDIVRPLVSRLGLDGRVRFLGVIPDNALRSLYAGALAVVHASFAEGFGLPPLEAMACGTPVIASDRTSLPEILGDAALFVDPSRVDSIRDAVARIVRDSALRSSLAAAGSIRAEQFRWRAAAIQALKIYESLA